MNHSLPTSIVSKGATRLVKIGSRQNIRRILKQQKEVILRMKKIYKHLRDALAESVSEKHTEKSKAMKNKKILVMAIVVILVVILHGSIIFGATWLFEQTKNLLENMPKHIRPPH